MFWTKNRRVFNYILISSLISYSIPLHNIIFDLINKSIYKYVYLFIVVFKNIHSKLTVENLLLQAIVHALNVNMLFH